MFAGPSGTGKTMAAVCKAKRVGCLATYNAATKVDPSKTTEAAAALKECVKGCKEALTRWVKYVKPSVNSALAATWGGLETARLAGQKETDVLKLIKPGACALIKGVEAWKGLLGDKLAGVIGPLVALKGLVCP